MLFRSLSKLMAYWRDDWGKHLDAAVFATNSSIHCTTKVTLFRMTFGREPSFPLQAEKAGEQATVENVSQILQSADAESILGKILEKQEAILMAVDVKIKEAQKKQKDQYKKCKGNVDYDRQ